MVKRIVVIEPDGSERELPHYPTLDEFQKIVGGYIESVRVRNRRDGTGGMSAMFLNEEGKLKFLPINPIATRIFRASHPGNLDIIMGPVVYFEGWTDQELDAADEASES